MTVIGTVESLWRYPVKSMRGESLGDAFMGFSGVYGDRYYAFKNSAARKGFPYLNAVAQHRMLGYQPRFRNSERAGKPPNMAEAMRISPGATPANADPNDMALDVVTPSGAVLAVDDPSLLEMLGEGLGDENRLQLVRSDRAMTDCRPISLMSQETIRGIETALAFPVDQRRFRANIYFEPSPDCAIAEEGLVGRRLRLGSRAEMMVLERDPRCKMISLDPESGDHDPRVLRQVAQANKNFAGVYCAVLVEGVLRVGDAVEVID